MEIKEIIKLLDENKMRRLDFDEGEKSICAYKVGDALIRIDITKRSKINHIMD